MARERIQPSNVCFVLDWETEASNNIFFQVCKENTADVRMANVSGKADVLEPKTRTPNSIVSILENTRVSGGAAPRVTLGVVVGTESRTPCRDRMHHQPT